RRNVRDIRDFELVREREYRVGRRATAVHEHDDESRHGRMGPAPDDGLIRVGIIKHASLSRPDLYSSTNKAGEGMRTRRVIILASVLALATVALVPMQAQRQGGAGGGGRGDAPTIGGAGELLAGAGGGDAGAS